MASRDPYDEQQKRLQALFDAASTPESSQDPFADDEEYGSNIEYLTSGAESTSSEDATRASNIKDIRKITATISSGESTCSSSSDSYDDSNKTSCSDSEEPHGNVAIAKNVHEPDDLVQELILRANVELVHDVEFPDVSQGSGEPSSVDPLLRISDMPVTDESWCNTVTEKPDFNFDSSECGITVKASLKLKKCFKIDASILAKRTSFVYGQHLQFCAVISEVYTFNNPLQLIW